MELLKVHEEEEEVQVVELQEQQELIEKKVNEQEVQEQVELQNKKVKEQRATTVPRKFSASRNCCFRNSRR